MVRVTILVVVGVLSLGVCCLVKVVMVVVMMVGVVVVVVMVWVTGNERATTTTINIITNTKTPYTPIIQVNKSFLPMAAITTTPITA